MLEHEINNPNPMNTDPIAAETENDRRSRLGQFAGRLAVFTATTGLGAGALEAIGNHTDLPMTPGLIMGTAIAGGLWTIRR